jgi:hypothetical protein
MRKIIFILLSTVLLNSCSNTNARQYDFQVASTPNKYNFLTGYDHKQSIAERVIVPEGFSRIEVKSGSFADWLRHLQLKPGKPDVHLFNGKLKGDQNVHYAVVDIDVGDKDLQQCADAVIRMRAEYLFSIGDLDKLHFNFTSGDNISFKKWSSGYKPVIKGNHVTWIASPDNNSTYKSFKRYLNLIFTYSGTLSLSKELTPVTELKKLQIGDVFIFGGSPGHAVLIVDACENKKTGEILFMIVQSYMPAQEIHILKNKNDSKISPWYSINFSGDLNTPEWIFKKDQLMRFGN